MSTGNVFFILRRGSPDEPDDYDYDEDEDEEGDEDDDEEDEDDGDGGETWYVGITTRPSVTQIAHSS